MTVRLGAVGVLAPSQGPALPDEDTLAHGGLVDVDDAPAGFHQTNQLDSKLLPLHARTEQVSSLVHDLGLLELQPEVRGHDLADSLLRQPRNISTNSIVEHLLCALDAAVLRHQLGH